METDAQNKIYGILANGIFFKFGPGRFPVIEIDTQLSGNSLAMAANCVIVGNLTEN